MRINDFKDYLKAVLSNEKRIPLMIWSGPGIGKSSAVRQVAEELKMDFIDLRLSLLNPVDLRGLPVVDREKGLAKWIPPEFLPNEKNHKSKGILFLDEINLAPQSVMAAGYQLILDGCVGEYVLPKEWKVIAAGNRAEDNASVTKFPSPLANRFVHVDIDADIKVWRNWAFQNNVSDKIITFLSKFPQHLYEQPKAGVRSFPTPRSWESASKLFSSGLDIDAAVGEGVASVFKAFLKVYERMPDPDAILAGTLTNKPPKEMDVLWALVMALVTRLQPEPKMVSNFMNYISDMPKEYEVLAIANSTRKSDKLQLAISESKEWDKWINDPKNKDILDYENNNS